MHLPLAWAAPSPGPQMPYSCQPAHDQPNVGSVAPATVAAPCLAGRQRSAVSHIGGHAPSPHPTPNCSAADFAAKTGVVCDIETIKIDEVNTAMVRACGERASWQLRAPA